MWSLWKIVGTTSQFSIVLQSRGEDPKQYKNIIHTGFQSATYKSYSQARSRTKLPELNQLRQEACEKWALKAQASPKHTHLFPLNPSQIETRHKMKFSEPLCKTARYFNSPVPSMIRTLNKLSRSE